VVPFVAIVLICDYFGITLEMGFTVNDAVDITAKRVNRLNQVFGGCACGDNTADNGTNLW